MNPSKGSRLTRKAGIINASPWCDPRDRGKQTMSFESIVSTTTFHVARSITTDVIARQILRVNLSRERKLLAFGSTARIV
jgi:hypothetical protein